MAECTELEQRLQGVLGDAALVSELKGSLADELETVQSELERMVHAKEDTDAACVELKDQLASVTRGKVALQAELEQTAQEVGYTLPGTGGERVDSGPCSRAVCGATFTCRLHL